MTCHLDIHTKKQNRRLYDQVVTLQEDLSRLSEIVTYLAGLSDEASAAFDISDQLDSIHHCLNRFEARCLAIQVAAYENEFVEPYIDEEISAELVFPNHRWDDVRKDARRANKLANQLTLTLTKIRTGMGGLQSQSPVPEDIEQINQVVSTAVHGLTSEWNGNPG
jgi:hypothetical protein